MKDISKIPYRKGASSIKSVKVIAEKACAIPGEDIQSDHCNGTDCKVLGQYRVQNSKASHSRDVATDRPDRKDMDLEARREMN